VVPHKGHDVLVAALADLADLADLSWRCRCVGTVDRDPGFVARVTRGAAEAGIDAGVVFTGSAGGTDLDRIYHDADLLVLASRAESYGMVATEALARGLPVVATAVGGLPEALGEGPDGTRPGVLVPPGDAPALAAALRSWLQDSRLRERLRATARGRRLTLAGWPQTSHRIGTVLAGGSP